MGWEDGTPDYGGVGKMMDPVLRDSVRFRAVVVRVLSI